MTPDEIVNALRSYAKNAQENFEVDTMQDFDLAANLIESLQAQLAENAELLDAAINAQETLQRALNHRAQPDNEPLTLEQLREMVGEPVWESWTGSWRIVTTAHDGETTSLYNAYNTISAKSVLYNDGRIYRRPLEGSE